MNILKNITFGCKRLFKTLLVTLISTTVSYGQVVIDGAIGVLFPINTSFKLGLNTSNLNDNNISGLLLKLKNTIGRKEFRMCLEKKSTSSHKYYFQGYDAKELRLYALGFYEEVQEVQLFNDDTFVNPVAISGGEFIFPQKRILENRNKKKDIILKLQK
ncbi:MAG: hypothetical protein COB98_09490 [Flavobacteriaceae bacterium]|nr:MAG: hypothetical protein COB98_09490 [Flavobacteriaceae bacterium]